MLALIALFPFLGFLVNAFLGRKLTKAVSGGVACAAMLASFVVSASVVWPLVGRAPDDRIVEQTLFTWIASGDFQLPLTLRVDPLSALMILVVTGIGFLIHLYSTSYMHEETDGEYARYFSYLNLFAFFMLVLVLGANFLIMFVGWEGVGLCSYLLIGFWFTKPSASDAGKKAFIVNRVGDFAFILGVFMVFTTFGTLDFLDVARQIAPSTPEAVFGGVSVMTLLLFIGATGKSAQIPLYVWLPDAMEGPTPVSALIHAATMVTAGVYMIGRNAELFAHAPHTLEIVAVIGALTALMAGTIGLVQNDIKRVLAYSTVSQLGYMFLAMGLGAFSAGIFHLYTHAFFKALMFLGSGAVIHALHGEQDMRKMGGLKGELPITYYTFLVGALAIAGIPPLAGFFSKDEILFNAFVSGHTILWVMGVLTALLTATYMFRLVFMTFHGPRATAGHAAADAPHVDAAAHDAHAPADAHALAAGADAGHGHAAAADHGHGHGGHGHGGHLHDAPPAMAIPLIVLAIGSVFAGLVGVPHGMGGSNRIEQFLHPSFHPAAAHAAAPGGAPAQVAETSPEAEGAEHATGGNESLELGLAAFSVLIGLAGIGLAAFFFLANPARAEGVRRQFSGLHRLLLNKYYVDEAYDATIVTPIKNASVNVLWKSVDASIIDGAVNGTGALVRGGAMVLRAWQTGSVRTYAASLFVGVLLVIGYYLTR